MLLQYNKHVKILLQQDTRERRERIRPRARTLFAGAPWMITLLPVFLFTFLSFVFFQREPDAHR